MCSFSLYTLFIYTYAKWRISVVKYIFIILGYLLYNLRRFANYVISVFFQSDISPLKCKMGSDTFFIHPENILIGNDTYINGGMFVAGKKSKIIIGDYCLISYNVHIRTTMHNYTNYNMPIVMQGETEKDIIIGNNVWIGYGVQILNGVTIEDGAIIAAGAVVTKNIGKNEVWGGVPAQFIKMR